MGGVLSEMSGRADYFIVAIAFLPGAFSVADGLGPVTDAMRRNSTIEDSQPVTSRFGIARRPGETQGANKGRSYFHDGIDISGPSGVPVYAAGDGVVSESAYHRGIGPHVVTIRLTNGDYVSYGHMQKSKVAKGQTVKKGDVIGLSGGMTGRSSSAVPAHVHFFYAKRLDKDTEIKRFDSHFSGNLNKDAFFAKQVFSSNASSGKYKFWFGGAQKIDASPYFESDYGIRKNRDGQDLRPYLGYTLKTSYQRLYGASAVKFNVDSSAATEKGYTPVQQAANNSLALIAEEQAASNPALANAPTMAFLFDDDGSRVGAIPDAPVAEYAQLSEREMLASEARRRFNSDAGWTESLMTAPNRMLLIDYLKARAVGAVMQQRIAEKQQRVEGLLALLTSLKMEPMRRAAKSAHERLSVNAAKTTIK
jgi:murein DD-endopeptidase MepM/ murein hydrolase activator NlpD